MLEPGAFLNMVSWGDFIAVVGNIFVHTVNAVLYTIIQCEFLPLTYDHDYDHNHNHKRIPYENPNLEMMMMMVLVVVVMVVAVVAVVEVVVMAMVMTMNYTWFYSLNVLSLLYLAFS